MLRALTLCGLLAGAAGVAACGEDAPEPAGPPRDAARQNATAAAPPPAGTLIADWRMDEPRGARTMADSGPRGLDVPLDDGFMTGARAGGATAYRWPAAGREGVRPERLITVDGPTLDPGRDGFAVTVRFRTDVATANLVQKGQATTPGGHFKLELTDGRAFCLFRGSAGLRAAGSPGRLDDGRWHTVRCERRPDAVALTVDDAEPVVKPGRTSAIAADLPLSIAGKASCDPPAVDCDYFAGELDFVRLERLP